MEHPNLEDSNVEDLLVGEPYAEGLNEEELAAERLNRTLAISSGEGNLEAVIEALDRGADINYRNGIPIGRAILSNHVRVVEFLLGRGAVMNHSESLLLAVMSGGGRDGAYYS